MLMRTDPFRDFDRLTQQLLGTSARPSAMLMDAWREGDHFVVEFDLPGVSADSVDLDVERNVLTVTAQRPALNEGQEFLAAERARVACSAGNSSSATTWTLIGSRPATATAS